MSTVDKTINAKIKQESFFRNNLIKILERTNQAVASIAKQAKAKGMEMEDGIKKELFAKSLLETVNRFIF